MMIIEKTFGCPLTVLTRVHSSLWMVFSWGSCHCCMKRGHTKAVEMGRVVSLMRSNSLTPSVGSMVSFTSGWTFSASMDRRTDEGAYNLAWARILTPVLRIGDHSSTLLTYVTVKLQTPQCIQ